MISNTNSLMQLIPLALNHILANQHFSLTPENENFAVHSYNYSSNCQRINKLMVKSGTHNGSSLVPQGEPLRVVHV